MNAANTLDNTRDLLIAALNKNQVTFAQIAKTAESISNGQLKLKLDGGGKVFVFEYLNKHIILDLTSLKLHGHHDKLTLNVNNTKLTDNLSTKYALIDHNHDDKYSSKTHNHDAYYASKTHNQIMMLIMQLKTILIRLSNSYTLMTLIVMVMVMCIYQTLVTLCNLSHNH